MNAIRQLLAQVLILSFFYLAVSVPALAQGSATQANSTPSSNSNSSPDVKKAVDDATNRMKQASGTVDPKAMDAQQAKLPRQKPMSKNTKVALIAVASVALAALVFLLIKYGKDCVRFTPAGCSFADDGCTCAEYAPEK